MLRGPASAKKPNLFTWVTTASSTSPLKGRNAMQVYSTWNLARAVPSSVTIPSLTLRMLVTITMNPCLPVHVPSTCESDRERGRALRVSGRSYTRRRCRVAGESERGGLGDVTGRETHLASKFLSQHLLHVLPEVTRLQEDVLVQLEVEEHLGAPRPIPALPPLPRARSRPRFASSTAPASRDRVSRVSARGRPRSVSRGDAEVARSDDRRTVVYPSSPTTNAPFRARGAPRLDFFHTRRCFERKVRLTRTTPF